MTNSEAIEYGKEQLEIFGGQHAEFIRMAISALSNSQNQSDSLIRASADAVSEADVIYRADAIDALKKNTFRLTFAEEQNFDGHVAWSAEAVYSDVMEGALLELPSAQSEIVRCKECKHYEDGWIHCNRVTWWNGEDDYCSRAEREDND